MDKMPKRYPQKMYLFFIYGSFIMILLGIFFAFTYSHYKKNELENASRELENMCASVENSVSTQLDSLSTISLNIVYSNAIKKNFKEFSSYQQGDLLPDHLISSREKAVAIHDIVTAIIGAYQSASSIKLYTLDGYCVESGYSMRMTTVDLNTLPWYEEVLALNGHKYLSPPIVNTALPAKGDNQKSQKFISLSRLFLEGSGEPEGIVEVIQDCDKIFSLVSQLEKQNQTTCVYVFNSKNELMYPYNPTGDIPDYFPLLENSNLPESTASFIKNDQGERVLFTYQSLKDYDWTIVMTKPKAVVYDGLNNFRSIFLLIGAASILVTLVICFVISQRLTLPLQKLTTATGKITITRVLDETKVDLTSADSNIAELSQLCESIRTMYEQLRATSQDILLSRSEESRAKLQATQSLINPHFLYNCLTNMSIMAEEEMNEDIIEMCQALCDYFRYISSSQDMIVPLEEEIFYTKRYLECMRLRFHEELTFDIQIAPETAQLYIPKLIIQPVVENAFKYGFNRTPPWKLSISSSLEHDNWILRIQDNGGNLSDAKKNELLHTYQHLNMDEELKSMQIGGMGLKNIYLRLKLLYGEKAIFRIENTRSQKTIFILGGPIYHSREEHYEQHPKL